MVSVLGNVKISQAVFGVSVNQDIYSTTLESALVRIVLFTFVLQTTVINDPQFNLFVYKTIKSIVEINESTCYYQ